MNLSQNKLSESLKNERIQILNDNWIVTNRQFNNIVDEVNLFFKSFHEKNPYSSGMIKDVILNSLIIEPLFLDFLLDFLNKKNKLKFIESKWSLKSFNISLSQKELDINKKIINIIDSKGFNAINIKELNHIFSDDYNLISKMIEIELSNKVIILVDGCLLFSKNNMDNLSQKVEDYFSRNETLNIKEFKELTNTTRKYAVPLLEYFDKIGLTYRAGNERKYKK
jgi:selenocysteine-specific elongation factor